MNQKYEKGAIDQWINEFQRSGVSIYEFCKGKPFHASDLYHWLECAPQTCTKHIAEPLVESDFIEVEGMWPCSEALITIHYPNGIRIELN